MRQAVRKLGVNERMSEGTDLTAVLRQSEIAESRWKRWRSQYDGMTVDTVERRKELESENAQLKNLLAEVELDKAMLKELAEGKW